MRREPLTGDQYEALLRVFARYADDIDRVDLFGSRARGDHRAGSDIDLLVHGRLTSDRLANLAADLDAADLSLATDLHFAGDLRDDRFAEFSRADATPLFTHEQLANAQRG